MLSTEVIDCFKAGKKITHRNGNSYKILFIGEMKEHGVWKPSATYREVRGCGKVYTRALLGFDGFTYEPDIILDKQDKINRLLRESPIKGFWTGDMAKV